MNKPKHISGLVAYLHYIRYRPDPMYSSKVIAALYLKPLTAEARQRYQGFRPNLAGDSGFDLWVPETVEFEANERKIVSMDVAARMELRTPRWFAHYHWMYCFVNFFNLIAQTVPSAFGLLCFHLFRLFGWGGWEEPDCDARDICPYASEIVPYNIFARSSIAKTPLLLHNSVGVVDSGYRGPLKAALYNPSQNRYVLNAGERVVQLCAPSMIPISDVHIVDELDNTLRGARGFGSTNATTTPTIASVAGDLIVGDHANATIMCSTSITSADPPHSSTATDARIIHGWANGMSVALSETKKNA